LREALAGENLRGADFPCMLRRECRLLVKAYESSSDPPSSQSG